VSYASLDADVSRFFAGVRILGCALMLMEAAFAHLLLAKHVGILAELFALVCLLAAGLLALRRGVWAHVVGFVLLVACLAVPVLALQLVGMMATAK
jgi:hypothetical protein